MVSEKKPVVINCSWTKSKYEFDSRKIIGKLIEIDTFPESVYNMKYQLFGDSLLCIGRITEMPRRWGHFYCLTC